MELGAARRRLPTDVHLLPASGVDFDAFFDEVFPSLFRYCMRLTGDADTAEDIAQEAFVRFARDEPDGPPRALRVWLFKVATHLVRDRYRVSENRRRLLEKNPVVPAPAPDPGQNVERSETIAGVRRALATLSERDRQLLLMRGEGFSYKEMADEVGVKVTSVGTLLARAEKRFVGAYDGRSVGSDSQGEHDASG